MLQELFFPSIFSMFREKHLRTDFQDTDGASNTCWLSRKVAVEEFPLIFCGLLSLYGADKQRKC